jgi:predicted ribosome quality control (RQC) complex YloA/Tae2 family protein
MNLKLKDLKTLRTTLENTIEHLTTNGVNNALLITLDSLRQNNNDLIDELETIERLSDDTDFSEAVKDAIDELDNIDTWGLSNALSTLNDLTDDYLETDDISNAIDELRNQIENCEPKTMTDKTRDDTDLDDLLKALTNGK